MRPLLEKLISIRLSADEHQCYTRAAADLGLSLSEYLRLRLVSIGDDYVADQIAQLRLTLLDNATTEENETTALMLETVLLLRRLCKPSELRSVHADMQRLGHPPWSSPPSSSS